MGLGNLRCDGSFFKDELCSWLKDNPHPNLSVEEDSVPRNAFFAFGIGDYGTIKIEEFSNKLNLILGFPWR